MEAVINKIKAKFNENREENIKFLMFDYKPSYCTPKEWLAFAMSRLIAEDNVYTVERDFKQGMYITCGETLCNFSEPHRIAAEKEFKDMMRYDDYNGSSLKRFKNGKL